MQRYISYFYDICSQIASKYIHIQRLNVYVKGCGLENFLRTIFVLDGDMDE